MRWVTFCRIFFISEAAFAALINLYVLVTVWRRRIDSNASTYRIGLPFDVTNLFTEAVFHTTTPRERRQITCTCIYGGASDATG